MLETFSFLGRVRSTTTFDVLLLVGLQNGFILGWLEQVTGKWMMLHRNELSPCWNDPPIVRRPSWASGFSS